MKKGLTTMVTSTMDVTIKAPAEQVWYALTNSDQLKAWMKSIEVETDWQEQSKITYTCYDENGKVLRWKDQDMIWSGVIETIIPNQEFTCSYAGSDTGLERETYALERLDPDTTKIVLTQHCATQEVADDYKDGSQESLNMLKDYLEN